MDHKTLRSDQTKIDNLEREAYGDKLGLYYDLIFLFKTKKQAHELLEIQYLCFGLYRNWYNEAIEIKIHDKPREYKKILAAIETLKSHLWNYHLVDGLEIISKLNEIQPTIDKLMGPKSNYKIGAVSLLDEIQDEITKRLKKFNFSETAIEKEIMPVFTAMIKSKIQ